MPFGGTCILCCVDNILSFVVVIIVGVVLSFDGSLCIDGLIKG
jgi:hypothetical protein